MSRTLHYGVVGEYTPDEKQSYSIFQLVHKYNELYEWTAEKLDLSTIRIYPNFDVLLVKDWNEAEYAVYEQIQKLTEEKAGFFEAISQLEQKKIIKTRKMDHLRGFTKVSSNEFNALAVIKFVIEASKLIPEQTFYLMDEGFALYCPLYIKNGLAKPDYKEMTQLISSNNQQSDADAYTLSKLNYYTKLVELDLEFGDVNGYIRPIKDQSYLLERATFKSILIPEESIAEISHIIEHKQFSEIEESKKYYSDINEFPLG